MHLVDSLGKNKALAHVSCLHEQGAAIAAEAYGQVTNNLGVALVTTGPGSTNAITGVAGAWTDSTPMLIISGQVKRSDMMGDSGLRQKGMQEIDIVSIVEPITKYAVTVNNPGKIRYHMEKAIHMAKSGRPGPVWIDIPLDVQGSIIDKSALKGFELPERRRTDHRDLEAKIKKTIGLLNESERPVLLAGNGIRLSKAGEYFRKFVDVLEVPVLTTWRALDVLPQDYKFFFGRPGSVGQRGANFIQQNSDLIISVGARLDFGQTGYGHRNFARAAKKIIVDIDPAEIEKLHKMDIDTAIVADAKDFLTGFATQMSTVEKKNRSSWLGCCAEWKRRYPVILDSYWDQDKPVNNYVLIDAISDAMAETGVNLLVPGSSGGCSEVTLQSFKVTDGQRVVNSPGLGAMGFGLPASIGACLASGKEKTISIISDGGFQLNIQELETAARLDLPIKYFVLNNQGYGSIKATQETHFNKNYVGCDSKSGLTMPDTKKIAAAYDIDFSNIDSHKDIKEKVIEVIRSTGPHICEVMLDTAQKTAPKVASMVKDDGTIVSKPLEDLWPFLDREELKSNMIIPLCDE